MGFKNSYDLFHNKMELFKIYEKLSRPIIISDNITSQENMGAILRLAGNIGAVNSLFVFDNDHKFSDIKIDRLSSGASKKTKWSSIKSNELLDSIPSDYTIIAVETTDDATDIYQTSLPEKTAFLIGNETNGISENLMPYASHKVYIPMPGPIASLNVSHALSIALFEWLRQHYK